MSTTGRAGAHRDIERGKVPSAARVACVPRSACTSVGQNSNKLNLSVKSGTMGRIVGYIYTSIYYCCKSFSVLLHDVMVGGWIASYVFIFIFWSRCCCCCCLMLLLPTTSVLKRREMLGTSIAVVVLGCFDFCPLDCDASVMVVDCAAVETGCMLEK